MPKELNKKLKHYLKHIDPIISIKYAYIFGSYHNASFDPHNSDIDIAIFSNKINGHNRHKYNKECFKATLPYKLDIQPIVYSTKDFYSTNNPFIKNEILAKGLKIWG